MKVKNQEAIIKEAKLIFHDNFKKLKLDPTKRWHRIKAKILGLGWVICAMEHDNKILRNIQKEFHNLVEEIEEGYYHIEVTMDDAGFHPLPCPLCKGEKKVYKESRRIDGVSEWDTVYYADFCEECPVCRGSGYMPALTKGEERLLKESKQIEMRCI